MHLSTISILKCPYCGSNFTVKKIFKQKNEERESAISFGIIKCECGTYPIVEDILVLRKNPIIKQVIDLMDYENPQKIVILCLWMEYFDRINSSPAVYSKIGSTLRTILQQVSRLENERKFRTLYRSYADTNLSFCSLMDKDILGVYGPYFKNRFSTDSFWSMLPFLPLLNKKSTRILDLCCGAGHTSFILDEYVKAKEIYCADYSFQNLYLTKKYFSYKIEGICLDANYPLPFPDEFFSATICSDAFFMIFSRFALSKQLSRVVSKYGFLLLTHLHNQLLSRPDLGYPLTPKAWKNLFTSKSTIVKSESTILNDFFFQKKLDLSTVSNEHELNASEAVLLAQTHDESLFRSYNNVNDLFLKVKNNLRINPIYETREIGQKIELRRRPIGNTLGENYPFADKYLPRLYQIDNNSLIDKKIDNKETIEDLMMKFILLNVPLKYM